MSGRATPTLAIAAIALLGLACAPRESPPEPVIVRVPARIAMALTPGAESFVAGDTGRVTAQALDHAGLPMEWSAPRHIKASDSTVLSVTADGAVRALRLGRTWLTVTWAGAIPVRDSLRVTVAARSYGRMRFFSFEGGCWVIEVDARTAYSPTDLPVAYKVDGLRVRFTARPSRYDGDFCMVGTLVDLDSISVESP
jgi:hypothetical protein